MKAQGGSLLLLSQKVTPLARRMALAHGVELAGLVGTGPGGRICAADIRALVSSPDLVASRSPGLPASRPPGLPASRSPGLPVSRPPGPPASRPPGLPVSRPHDIPVATVTVELDVSESLAAARGAGRAWQPVGLTAVVVAAAAELLPAFPELNAAWGGDVAVLRRRTHVAVAAGGRWALVGDAGDLTARGVARAMAGGPGHGGGIPNEGTATFAVVSLAAGVGWQSAAPPLPGTTAALSLGAAARRVVAWGDGVAVRPVATLTLAYDARLVDHHRAAAFLCALRAALESAGA